MTPKEAYEHAEKHGPSEETRKIACKDLYFAFWYAKNIDECPQEDTREAACKESYNAFYYALLIDKCPWDNTREAACKDSLYAYCYALEIDKCFREDTWMAVKGTEYEEKYKRILKKLVKEQII